MRWILIAMVALGAASCEIPNYDYCYDEDIFVNGRFSHSEQRCGYYQDANYVNYLNSLEDDGTTTSS